jgi:hypothetical protein
LRTRNLEVFCHKTQRDPLATFVAKQDINLKSNVM